MVSRIRNLHKKLLHGTLSAYVLLKTKWNKTYSSSYILQITTCLCHMNIMGFSENKWKIWSIFLNVFVHNMFCDLITWAIQIFIISITFSFVKRSFFKILILLVEKSATLQNIKNKVFCSRSLMHLNWFTCHGKLISRKKLASWNKITKNIKRFHIIHICRHMVSTLHLWIELIFLSAI